MIQLCLNLFLYFILRSEIAYIDLLDIYQTLHHNSIIHIF